ncbi:MAG: biotin--[acetyl-CoA-carboxylase] ligase [Brevinemataceae bacterium]
MYENNDGILLKLLENINQYYSGEKLAQEFGISRAAVHKKIQKLRQLGFIIEASSRNGFVCKNPFPNYLKSEIIYHYSKSLYPIYVLETCGSTNKVAYEMIGQNKSPFFLFARDQSLGKGRMGREWNMQKDKDIALSFAAPVNIIYDQLFSLIQLSSLAVYKTLVELSNMEFYIKWPNDIISVNDKKICGILTESVFEDKNISYIVIGIGININSIDLPDFATSLSSLGVEDIDINRVAALLIDNFVELWKKFPDNQDELFLEWESLLAWKGMNVALSSGDKRFEGLFSKVNKDGSLILNINGKEQIFNTGDLLQTQFRKLD